MIKGRYVQSKDYAACDPCKRGKVLCSWIYFTWPLRK